MLSDRVTRQIERLLAEAEAAFAANDWETVRARCGALLLLDPEHPDARTYLAATPPPETDAPSPRFPVQPLPRETMRTLGGTITLLFSDIEGSASLNEQLGDSAWMRLLRAHNAIVRKHVEAGGGSEVKAMGDGFMLAFAGARQAVRCAVAIQQEVATSEPLAQVRVRMGLHTGRVIREAEDFFGTQVNLAARVGRLARGGEILVSGMLHDVVAASGEFKFDSGREVEFRGLSGAHRVYAVVVPPSAAGQVGA